MHILSHYFLELEQPSVYHKFGVIVPDLFRRFNQHLRKEVFSHDILENQDHQQLFNGIKRHYEGDHIFHDLPIFHELMDVTKKALLQAPIPPLHKRTYFMAHILPEFLISRVLVSQQDDVLDRFYSDINNVKESVIRQYFVTIGKGEQADNVFSNFDRFRQGKYLYQLLDNEMFANALLRLYSQIRPVELSKREKEAFINVTLELEATYISELSEVLMVVKSQLSPQTKPQHE